MFVLFTIVQGGADNGKEKPKGKTDDFGQAF